ncbi:MAG: hypothetical protein H7138_24845 [Myxococcales bacterium]|nr:hypothetical protein [Myxococcales bacterium]
MVWHPATILRVLGPVALLACGGGKKVSEEPKTDDSAMNKPPVAAPETEEDREKKRHAEALALIPEGSSCLPAELRTPNAPRLELAAIGTDAVVCAIDQDRTRLLGPVGCWSIEVAGDNPGALTYQPAAPLPGRGLAVTLDDRCARGYCLPKDAEAPKDPVALLSWNLNSTKVAVLAADTVHLYDAASKAHESSFSIRGERGVVGEPTAVHWNGEAVFVEATDGTAAPVWVFKVDGTLVGPIEPISSKAAAPLSTRGGSFVLLDKARVAIAEQGMSTLTVYESATGKRTKLVRKLPASSCKKGELEELWRDPGADASAKCKDYVGKTFAHLTGADAVAGTKNLLVLLRGPRLGELAVIDAKTLAERKSIKMPWCDEAGGAASTDKESAAPPADKRGAPKPKADDPDAGGE